MFLKLCSFGRVQGRRQVGVLPSDDTGLESREGLWLQEGKEPWEFGTWEKMTWIRERHLAGDDHNAIRVLTWGLKVVVRNQVSWVRAAA